MTQAPTGAISRSWTNLRVVISADAKPPLVPWAEIWAYREVLYALVWREVKIRYAQTFAGVAWVILQPLLTTMVLSVLMRRWMGVPAAEGLPYALFAYSGLVPWIYFTHVLTKSSAVLINSGLLSKAYFPRLLLPLGSAVGGLIDLPVAGTVLAGLIFYYGTFQPWSVLLLPGALLLVLLVTFGIGVWLAALNLFHRDVAHALPFTTQLLFFMTPVAYPMSVVEPSWRLIYSLNPMVAPIECWRWALFGGPASISLLQLCTSLAVDAVVIVSGLRYFSRHEATFADVGDT